MKRKGYCPKAEGIGSKKEEKEFEYITKKRTKRSIKTKHGYLLKRRNERKRRV